MADGGGRGALVEVARGRVDLMMSEVVKLR